MPFAMDSESAGTRSRAKVLSGSLRSRVYFSLAAYSTIGTSTFAYPKHYFHEVIKMQISLFMPLIFMFMLIRDQGDIIVA